MVYCESKSSLIYMLTLFYKPYCFYCGQVLTANEKIGAPLTLRNVVTDPTALPELLAAGGKGQTPFLIDTNRGLSIYESLDIIAYLDKYYRRISTPIVVSSGDICPIE